MEKITEAEMRTRLANIFAQAKADPKLTRLQRAMIRYVEREALAHSKEVYAALPAGLVPIRLLIDIVFSVLELVMPFAAPVLFIVQMILDAMFPA